MTSRTPTRATEKRLSSTIQTSSNSNIDGTPANTTLLKTLITDLVPLSTTRVSAPVRDALWNWASSASRWVKAMSVTRRPRRWPARAAMPLRASWAALARTFATPYSAMALKAARAVSAEMGPAVESRSTACLKRKGAESATSFEESTQRRARTRRMRMKGSFLDAARVY